MADKLQKIREEVERMHNLLPVMDGDNIFVNYADRICTTLEMYIDSLQEEPVSEELEKAANAYAVTVYNNYLDNPKAFENIDADTLNEDAFKAGANWQKQKTLKESEDAIQYVKENHSPSEVSDFQNATNIAVMKAFDAGKEKMREQMMKDATEVTVKIDAGGYPYIPAVELYDYDNDVPLAKERDKYKVILIKEN